LSKISPIQRDLFSSYTVWHDPPSCSVEGIFF
jgi:hypothetical protein